MAEILFIAPLPELAEVARSVCKGEHNIDITVARMEAGVKLALEGEKKGYQVIISRGVTSWMIRRSQVTLPVVDVLIGGYDIVKAFFQAKQLGGAIGITDVQEIIEGIASLEEISGEKILKHTLTDQQEDINQGISYLKEQGAKVIIGKIAMANEARRQGLDAVVITSGREAVLRAIFEAKRVVYVRKQERHKAQQLKVIVDNTYDGIISMNKEGNIVVFNKVAEKLTGWTAENAIGRPVTDVIPKANRQNLLKNARPELGEILEIGMGKVVANRVPIIIDNSIEGVVTTFQPIDRLQSVEQKVRRKLADRGYVAKYHFSDIIGESKPIRDAIKLASDYASVDSTVLIYGQTGSGKEMFSHAIHNSSQRRSGPFVAINCAALPETLLESELFGYVEGAFTGARKGGKAGVFEMAHGGTLFLDEVGEMSPMLQARLLRVLEEGEIMRIGDNAIIPVNVRLVAATHRDLRKMVAENKFREDLFYRLNVLSVIVPPLNVRGTDILTIARIFLRQFSRKMGRREGVFTPSAQKTLLDYEWPGNIRELRNAMERLAMLVSEPEISAVDVQKALLIEGEPLQTSIPESKPSLKGDIEILEQELIKKTISECGGNKSEAARKLGISRTTLWRKIQENEI